MKIFIQSCHGSLEYDHARTFVDLGHQVCGSFDVGGTQRPKIAGVTDKNSEMEGCDVIILHQVPDFDKVMERLLQAGKKVIITAFGQGNLQMHGKVSELCRNYQHAYVAAYSKKEYEIYKNANCPPHKLELIRFGKYLQDYKPWKGDWPICYVTCNTIQRRGDGCGWHLLKEIEQKIPVILTGRHTEETDFGLGQVQYQALPNLYSHAQCFLSLGTVPAPITLNLIDAFCSGTPVVSYNNNCGVAGEGFGTIMCNNLNELIVNIQEVLKNKILREDLHRKSLITANLFDVRVIKQQWQQLLNKAAQ